MPWVGVGVIIIVAVGVGLGLWAYYSKINAQNNDVQMQQLQVLERQIIEQQLQNNGQQQDNNGQQQDNNGQQQDNNQQQQNNNQQQQDAGQQQQTNNTQQQSDNQQQQDDNQQQQANNDQSDDGNSRGESGSESSSGCFVLGTMVAAEGRFFPIEQVDLGDRIYSFDDTLQASREKAVVGVSRQAVTEVYVIGFNRGEIVCSRSQKFLCASGLVYASDLKPNDSVKCRSGKSTSIKQIVRESRSCVVFHLTLEGTQGYYVLPRPSSQDSVAHLEDGDDPVFSSK